MRYTNISADMWNDREFCSLSLEQKLAYVFVLTNPMCNAAGYYRLPFMYAQMCLGEGAKELKTHTELYVYDEGTEQMLIPNYLKYNTAKSVNQIKGVVSCVRSLEVSPLLVDFLSSVLKYVGEDTMGMFDQNLLMSAKAMCLERDDPQAGKVLAKLMLL